MIRRRVETASRIIILLIAGILLGLTAVDCANEIKPADPRAANPMSALSQSEVDYASLTEEEWGARLTPKQFRILREKGTERAFTGEYWDNKSKGIYHCAGCQQRLYDSKTKFESGTGWPSFYATVRDDAIETESDQTLGMIRRELLCSRCGGHLGHVFDDGPAPTGQRHCINSASLQFHPAEPGGSK